MRKKRDSSFKKTKSKRDDLTSADKPRPLTKSGNLKQASVPITPAMIAEIEKLASEGLNNGQIRDYYGFSQSTWLNYKKCHPEIDTAFRKGKARTVKLVISKLMEKILEGNLSAIIFYLKTQAGWSEYAANVDQENDKLAEVSLTISTNDPIEAARIYQKIMTGS